MFDLSAENLLNLLNLLWAVFGVSILWIANRVRKVVVRACSDYILMTKVILGDGENTPGIADRLGIIETQESLNAEHRNNTRQLTNSMGGVRSEIQSLREEVAISTSSTESLRKTVDAHGKSLEYIKKELTHNGGGSVKDMARDAAINSSRTLTLMRARDDMDTTTAYFISDSEGEYSWVSETFLSWTKFQQQDLRGFGWMNAVFPEDRSPVRAEWDNAVADDRDFLMEYRMWTKLREPFWVRAMAKKVHGDNSVVIGWYGSIQLMSTDDITQHLADIE